MSPTTRPPGPDCELYIFEQSGFEQGAAELLLDGGQRSRRRRRGTVARRGARTDDEATGWSPLVLEGCVVADEGWLWPLLKEHVHAPGELGVLHVVQAAKGVEDHEQGQQQGDHVRVGEQPTFHAGGLLLAAFLGGARPPGRVARFSCRRLLGRNALGLLTALTWGQEGVEAVPKLGPVQPFLYGEETFDD